MVGIENVIIQHNITNSALNYFRATNESRYHKSKQQLIDHLLILVAFPSYLLDCDPSTGRKCTGNEILRSLELSCFLNYDSRLYNEIKDLVA